MAGHKPLTGELLAVRCHDVTVSLQGKQVGDFDRLVILGMAVRLALHLRGVPAVPYELLKNVGLYLLQIPTTSLAAVVEVLGEAEFVRIDKQGKTIKSIVPTVPYYEDLYAGVGEIAENEQLSEPEQLTLTMLDRLAKSPTSKDGFADSSGAERKLIEKTVKIGQQGGYVIERRARGRDMLVSPVYFSENAASFADLSAGKGSGRVAKVISSLSQNQGWPLSVIEQQKRVGDITLTDEELQIVVALAGDGFSAPPAIKTSHAGQNYFLFSPKPSAVKLSPTKRHVYEAAMALVAAVRQGQLLPARYAIRYPQRLLESFKEKKFLRANTEATEQYQKLVALRIGRLVSAGGGFARFELIDIEENYEAIDMALALLRGESPGHGAVDDDVVLAFHKGHEYVDSLVGRQLLVEQSPVKLDADTRREIDDLLLRGAT